MDPSVGLTPSKLSLSESSVSVEVFVEPSVSVEVFVEPSVSVAVSVEPSVSVEVFVEPSVTADVSFEPPVSIRKLFDAPPSLEPPHADKNTEIESTLAEKNVRVISSYPFLNQLNYFRALAYLCQYLIAYWCITRHFSLYHLDDSKSVFHFCKNTQTRSYQTDQHLMARRYRESSAGAKKPFSHLCATYCETRHD